jgi:Domain of unknown function (DUF3943)
MDGGPRLVPRGGAVIGRSRIIAVAIVVFVTLLAPAAGTAGERYVLDWDSGTGKSYVIAAAEIVGFAGALNAFDRLVIDEDTYGTDGNSIWKNLHTAPEFDKDPFSVNQIGHPYQGSISYGLARSAGLSYLESLAGTLLGSFLWETAGETTAPSLNDYVTTTLGGSFVGEAMFRMASLLLEGGGETPSIWRELGAAVLSPGMGFNRLVFGDRFKPVFPSRDPAVFIRLRVGATLTTSPGTTTSVRSTSSCSSSRPCRMRPPPPTPSRTSRSAASSSARNTKWATTIVGCGASSAGTNTSRRRCSAWRRRTSRSAPSGSGG